MKKLVLLLGVVVSLVSCEGNMTATPCLGDCSAEFYVDSTVNEGSYVDENGFYVVKHSGFNYFTVNGHCSCAIKNNVYFFIITMLVITNC